MQNLFEIINFQCPFLFSGIMRACDCMKFKSGNDSRMAAASRLRGFSAAGVKLGWVRPLLFPGIGCVFKYSVAGLDFVGSNFEVRSISGRDVIPIKCKKKIRMKYYILAA